VQDNSTGPARNSLLYRDNDIKPSPTLFDDVSFPPLHPAHSTRETRIARRAAMADSHEPRNPVDSLDDATVCTSTGADDAYSVLVTVPRDTVDTSFRTASRIVLCSLRDYYEFLHRGYVQQPLQAWQSGSYEVAGVAHDGRMYVDRRQRGTLILPRPSDPAWTPAIRQIHHTELVRLLLRIDPQAPVNDVRTYFNDLCDCIGRAVMHRYPCAVHIQVVVVASGAHVSALAEHLFIQMIPSTTASSGYRRLFRYTRPSEPIARPRVSFASGVETAVAVSDRLHVAFDTTEAGV
jgi:hypothetical protein